MNGRGSSVIRGESSPAEKKFADGDASGGSGFLRIDDVDEAVERARDLEAFGKESLRAFDWDERGSSCFVGVYRSDEAQGASDLLI